MERIIDNIDNTIKSLESEAFNMELEIALAKEELLPFLEQAALLAGQGAVLLQGSDYDFFLSSQLLSTLDKRADLFTRSINETTFEELKRDFAESFELEETRQQLIKRIQVRYGQISKGRARTIAGTEVQVANQTGIFEGYRQAGAGIKIWVAISDGRTRESHVMVDGEEKPIDVPFSNGLMYPGDPTGSASEVINCRCSI